MGALFLVVLAALAYKTQAQCLPPRLPLTPILPQTCAIPQCPPTVATTIVDNSVSNALANAIQLLIVSNLVESNIKPNCACPSVCVCDSFPVQATVCPKVDCCSPRVEYINPYVCEPVISTCDYISPCEPICYKDVLPVVNIGCGCDSFPNCGTKCGCNDYCPNYVVPNVGCGCNDCSPNYIVSSGSCGCNDCSPNYIVSSGSCGCNDCSPNYIVSSGSCGCNDCSPNYVVPNSYCGCNDCSSNFGLSNIGCGCNDYGFNFGCGCNDYGLQNIGIELLAKALGPKCGYCDGPTYSNCNNNCGFLPSFPIGINVEPCGIINSCSCPNKCKYC